MTQFIDGDGDYIDYGKGYNLGQNFSFNVWIKPDKENLQRKDAAIFCKYETNGYGPYDFYISNNRPAFWISTGKGKDSYQKHVSNTKLNPDTWYMLTYTYSYEKQQLAIYINGEYDNSFSCVPVTQNSDKVTVGRQALMFQPYKDLQYKGWIDEMRIYDETLTDDYIKALYERYISMSELSSNTIVVPIENTPVSNPTMTEEVTDSARIFHLTPGYKKDDYNANGGGLYIYDLDVNANPNAEIPVTFYLYNTKDAVGYVEYYNEFGQFIRADRIAPRSHIINSGYKLLDETVKLIKSLSKHGLESPITDEYNATRKKIEAPRGTRTVIVTNNRTASAFAQASSLVDNLFDFTEITAMVAGQLKKEKAAVNQILITPVKEKITTTILKEIFKFGVDLTKPGLNLLAKEGAQKSLENVVQGIDVGKILSETLVENSDKIMIGMTTAAGKSAVSALAGDMLKENLGYIGYQAMMNIGKVLGKLSNDLTEKHLENVKPMIFYIENPSEGNVVPDISTNETEMLKKLVGIYKGSYFAGTSEVGTTLTIFEDNDGTFKAVWDFYNLSSKTNYKEGNTRCYVKYDIKTKMYSVQSYEWIDRKLDYPFLTLIGKLNGNIFSGDSQYRFSVTRINSVPDISTNETEMLKKLVGTYKGSYFTRQVERGMTLNVFQDTDGTFKATWDFYNLPGKNNTKHGMTKCKVSYDVNSKSYTIQSYEWINKPEGYVFMTLTGQLNGNILSGNSPAKFKVERTS